MALMYSDLNSLRVAARVCSIDKNSDNSTIIVSYKCQHTFYRILLAYFNIFIAFNLVSTL